MNYTKIVGVLVGTMTILFSIGFALFSFIGTSLGKALNSQTEASSFTPTLILLAVFLSIGLVTLIGALKVKSKASRIFYSWFCLSLGICFIIVCLFSLGALGNQSERFILFVGIVYLGLGFLTKRKKN